MKPHHAAATLACLLLVAPSQAAPATVAELADALDLVTLPLPEGAEMLGHQREAKLSYQSEQPSKQAFDFVDAQLTERGWTQMPGAQDHGEFVSADYTRGDFVAHVSVTPGGDGSRSVSVSHKGNVPLESVPVPDNVDKLYAFTATVMYKSPGSVEETAKRCEELMLAAGWTPYGGAGDTRYYRNNAVLAHVRVMSAPGQGGATVIDVTSEVLSLELPAPPFADGFRYTDGTTAILYDCDKSEAESAAFYRTALPPLGWTATTDEPVEIKWEKHTIFRNDAQDMITVSTHEFEGRTRTKLDHLNVAEVADEELRGLIDAGEKAKYDREVTWLPVAIALPGAESLEDWAVRASVERGGAFGLAERLVAALTAAGWSADEKAHDEPHLRTYRLEGHDRVLHIVALDPPKREPWVAVVGVGGVKLEAGE